MGHRPDPPQRLQRRHQHSDFPEGRDARPTADYRRLDCLDGGARFRNAGLASKMVWRADRPELSFLLLLPVRALPIAYELLGRPNRAGPLSSPRLGAARRLSAERDLRSSSRAETALAL